MAKLSARLGGSHDAELCRVALGVDANALAVATALGEEVREQELAPVAVRRRLRPLPRRPAGQLQEVTGLERAFAVDGVRGIRIYRKPGHVFRTLRRASDRAGPILATGATRDAAAAAAAAAAARIRFVTGPWRRWHDAGRRSASRRRSS